MVTKVKCVAKGCEWQNAVFTTTALFIAKIAPLDGPYICPKCEQPMKVVGRAPANYKPGAGAKAMTRRTTAILTGKKIVAKKSKPKAYKIKSSGPFLGGGKPAKKAGPRKSGPRKRGPSK